LYEVLIEGLYGLLRESPFGPEDFFGSGRQPMPTIHPPGSPEKVAELETRYFRRESLFSKLDADREADEPCYLSEEAA
jgi:hypothetical protein